MKCKLTIYSKGNGWENNTEVFADYCYEDGEAVINYFLDGDKCKLELDASGLVQERRGGVNIKITLRKGEKTFCILGDEEMRGGYEVVTKDFKVLVGKKGCVAEVTYLSGKDQEKINLSLRALAL
jgi:hypothetical protein